MHAPDSDPDPALHLPRRHWLRAVSGSGLALLANPVRAGHGGLSLCFISPGESGEPFWAGVTGLMQAGARSLGIELEVLSAERDVKRSLRLSRELAERPRARRPDYVVLVNEKGTLVENARVLGAAGIRSFAAFSGLLPQERTRWAPRAGLPRLLGSLEPRAEDAGYLTARALIERALAERRGGSGKLQMLAISGDRSTPVSIQRNDGLRRAIAEHPQVELSGQVFADWRRDRAHQMMGALMGRHPAARLLWTGSDLMGFGAIDALLAAGQDPARDWLISTINTSPDAMQAVVDGRMDALAGGHFLIGAWALVMLFDHHHGIDFASEGLEQVRPMFALFRRPEAQRYIARFGDGTPQLDLRPFSKALNPALKRYAFDVDSVLLK